MKAKKQPYKDVWGIISGIVIILKPKGKIGIGAT